MSAFRFPLAKVLEWRRTQLEMEELQFKRESAALAEIDRLRAECEASGIKAELQVRAWNPVTGRDLEALGSFRLQVNAREAGMALERAAQEKKLKAQEGAMLEASRRCRLLERLEERRAGEWRAAENRALETVASETYLAQWNRRRPKAKAPRHDQYNGVYDARDTPGNRVAPRPADSGRRQRAAPDDALPPGRLAGATGRRALREFWKRPRRRWQRWRARPRAGRAPCIRCWATRATCCWLHFRRSFEELNRPSSSSRACGCRIFSSQPLPTFRWSNWGFTNPRPKVYGALAASGVEPHSEEWKPEIESVLARQRQAMAPRLWPEIPAAKYLCFYPMDRRRGESANWYRESMASRQRLMHEHGMMGRRYAGEVRQIITGSIGFDDWEWGVDLFAEDPLVFKKLIYEMRFDEVSAVYALFGTFYVGLRVPAGELPGLLA